MAERLFVVCNANAGSAEQAAAVRAALSSRAGVTIVEPRSSDEARDLAAEAARKGYDLVVAAGGDGTVNAVVQGLAQHLDSARLGVLPLGTGNDLCRTLGLPIDPLACVPLLDTSRLRPLDLIRVESLSDSGWFINLAAGGNSGQMLEWLTPEAKRAWGPFCYLRGAINVMVDMVTYRASLSYDDAPAESVEALNLIVANGRYSAGGLLVAPRANPEDGLLDVIVIRDGAPMELATAAAHLVISDYLKCDLVSQRRARRVRIEAEPAPPFTADGDVLPREPLTFTVHARALPVVVGPDYTPRSPYEIEAGERAE